MPRNRQGELSVQMLSRENPVNMLHSGRKPQIWLICYLSYLKLQNEDLCSTFVHDFLGKEYICQVRVGPGAYKKCCLFTFFGGEVCDVAFVSPGVLISMCITGLSILQHLCQDKKHGRTLNQREYQKVTSTSYKLYSLGKRCNDWGRHGREDGDIVLLCVVIVETFLLCFLSLNTPDIFLLTYTLSVCPSFS